MEGADKHGHAAPGIIYPNISTSLRPEQDTSSATLPNAMTNTPQTPTDVAAGGSEVPKREPMREEHQGDPVLQIPKASLSGTIEAGPQSGSQLTSGSEVQSTQTPRQGAQEEGSLEGLVPKPIELDQQVLDENAQLQSATGVQVVKHSSTVDPTHHTENEEFGMEFRVMDSRMKYMLVVTGGMLLGAMIGVSRLTKGQAKKAKSATRSRTLRAKAGRGAALLSK